MSWISKQLKSVKKAYTHPKAWVKGAAKTAGKAWEAVDDYALPAVGFALGGPAGAALGSAAARGIGDGRFDPKATAIAGLKGYAGGQLAQGAGLVGGDGLSGVTNSLRSVGGQVAKQGVGQTARNVVTGGLGNVTGGASGGGVASNVASGGGWGSRLRSVGSWALDNPDILLAGAGMVQGAAQQGKADKLNQKALGFAEQGWKDTEALRKQSLDRMLNPVRPDLKSIYRSPNPFSVG